MNECLKAAAGKNGSAPELAVAVRDDWWLMCDWRPTRREGVCVEYSRLQSPEWQGQAGLRWIDAMLLALSPGRALVLSVLLRAWLFLYYNQRRVSCPGPRTGRRRRPNARQWAVSRRAYDNWWHCQPSFMKDTEYSTMQVGLESEHWWFEMWSLNTVDMHDARDLFT